MPSQGPLAMEIAGERGIWLPLPSARLIASLVQRLGARVANGARVAWPVEVQSVLAAIELESGADFRMTAGSGSAEVIGDADGALWARDVIGVRAAAELIRCGERNVRDLAARGSLQVLSRSPLTFDREVVTAYAVRRAAG